MAKAKNTICLWFDKDAQDAARFYSETFPDSKVIAVHKAPMTPNEPKIAADAVMIASDALMTRSYMRRLNPTHTPTLQTRS